MQNGLRALNLGGNEMKITCSDFKRNLALEWPPWWMGESQMRCDGVGEVFGGCGEELRVFLGWELEQNWGLLCLCMQPCVAFCLQEKG